jgi:hypothetical protein
MILRSLSLLALASCLVLPLSYSSAQTVVDSELLLLVDVSGSVDSTEYGLMMNGFADAFRSSSVQNAVFSGTTGGIAASLVFWSGNNQQAIGVGWTHLNSSLSMNAFADTLASLSRPFAGSTALGDAIDYGFPLFGHETGGVDNGFHSFSQIIDVAGDGENNSGVEPAFTRDAAFEAGVDMINGLPVGPETLATYYSNNVIGGSSGSVSAFVQPASTYSDFQNAMQMKLTQEIGAGAMQSLVAVPEPGSAMMIFSAGMTLMLRRRRFSCLDA